MDRINQTVLNGLIHRMGRAMGEELTLQKGSRYNGIAWAIERHEGSQAVVTGQSARELYEKAHAFISGYLMAQDKAKQTGN